MRSLFNKIVSLVFPTTCALCQKVLSGSVPLCGPCDSQVLHIRDPVCTICGMPLPETSPLSHPCGACLSEAPCFDWHRSCVVYDKGVDSLIHRFKYAGESHLVSLYIHWLKGAGNGNLPGTDFFVPVPLSPNRLRKRTWNQSLELSRALGKRKGVPVFSHALRKIRETPPQTGLSRKERIANLKNAFAWKGNKGGIEGKRVVLIDDVFTTGSTLSACAKALRPFKPKEIGALTIAINILKVGGVSSPQ